MLPAAAREPLLAHLEKVRRQHAMDLARNLGRAPLPDALSRKYPDADRQWAWQWVFPASRTRMDEETLTMPSELDEFAKRYAKAWCSQNPESVASFFAEGGSLSVNDDAPAMGRAAITEVARGFMTAFPDMVVTMDELIRKPEAVEFHWTLAGTNSGPGGTGKRVRISGYEEWHIDAGGLVAESKGHFDAAEYERQLEHGVDE